MDDGRELPLVKVETTSESHPFYTGTQKAWTLGGRVESSATSSRAPEEMTRDRVDDQGSRNSAAFFARPPRLSIMAPSPGRRQPPALVPSCAAAPAALALLLLAPPTCCRACSAATRGTRRHWPPSARWLASPTGQTVWPAAWAGSPDADAWCPTGSGAVPFSVRPGPRCWHAHAFAAAACALSSVRPGMAPPPPGAHRAAQPCPCLRRRGRLVDYARAGGADGACCMIDPGPAAWHEMTPELAQFSAAALAYLAWRRRSGIWQAMAAVLALPVLGGSGAPWSRPGDWALLLAASIGSDTTVPRMACAGVLAAAIALAFATLTLAHDWHRGAALRRPGGALPVAVVHVAGLAALALWTLCGAGDDLRHAHLHLAVPFWGGGDRRPATCRWRTGADAGPALSMLAFSRCRPLQRTACRDRLVLGVLLHRRCAHHGVGHLQFRSWERQATGANVRCCPGFVGQFSKPRPSAAAVAARWPGCEVCCAGASGPPAPDLEGLVPPARRVALAARDDADAAMAGATTRAATACRSSASRSYTSCDHRELARPAGGARSISRPAWMCWNCRRSRSPGLTTCAVLETASAPAAEVAWTGKWITRRGARPIARSGDLPGAWARAADLPGRPVYHAA